MRNNTLFAQALLLVTHCCSCTSGLVDIGDATGPGRVSGQVILNVPHAAFDSDGPIVDTAPIHAQVAVYDAFAMFRPQDTWQSTRSMHRELWRQERLDSSGTIYFDATTQGYAMPYDFNTVPLGSYELGYYYNSGGDWDIPTVRHMITQDNVQLTKANPEITFDHVVQLAGDRDYMYPPTIRVPVEPALYGRLFFRISDLATGTYGVSEWHGIPGQWENVYWQVDDEPAGSDTHLLQFSVAEGQRLVNLRAYSFAQWYVDSERFPDYRKETDQRNYGLLEVELRSSLELDFSRDIVLVAENADGRREGNSTAWNYVIAEHFHDGVAIYRLGLLHDGNYNVRLLQLGSTNDGPILVLDTLGTTVNLPYPNTTSPFPDFNWDGDEIPYNKVEFTVDGA